MALSSVAASVVMAVAAALAEAKRRSVAVTLMAGQPWDMALEAADTDSERADRAVDSCELAVAIPAAVLQRALGS